jgi:hypothetical protein
MYEHNAFTTLRDITTGYILSRCLHVVAELGVADVLDETPRTAAELAPLVNAHPDSLARVLALLAAHGIFEMQGDHFCHSPASRLLISDHPESVRTFALGFGDTLHWKIYERLDYTIRTGKPALKQLAPEGQWARLAANPEESEQFDRAMAQKAQSQAPAVLAAYDFSHFGVVADIGGGLGHMVRAIVESIPTVQGIVFDLPHVIRHADRGSSGRLLLQAGDFFADALPASDAYLLMEIIHDWGDEEALAILKAVRRAAPSHARLLIIDVLIPNDPGPDWSKVVDIHMMVMLGGRKRSVEQYATLLDAAGFTLQRVIETDADVTILEAVPT